MRMAQQRGVVLIVVLWITVLLTVLLVAFTATIKVDRDVASDIVQRVQARASAEAVLSYLVAIRQSGAYDWSDMTGQVYKLALNSMQVRFRFVPERAFVSLNAAPVEDLEVLLTAAGAENALAIAEYIVLRREGGVDRQTGALVVAKPWVSPAELSSLVGITPEIYKRIQNWFTVDSDHQSVDLEFAENDLVRALKGADAERFLAERSATEPVTGVADFVGLAQQSGDLVRVQVELSSTANKRKIETCVAFGAGDMGYRIARWNEYNARFSLE